MFSTNEKILKKLTLTSEKDISFLMAKLAQRRPHRKPLPF